MVHFYKGYRVAVYPVGRGFNFEVSSGGSGLTAAGYVLVSNSEAEAFEQIKLRIDILFPGRVPVSPTSAK